MNARMAPTLTLFDGARNASAAGMIDEPDWPSFCDAIEEGCREVAADKLDLPAFGPYRLRAGAPHTRADEHVEAITAAVIDVDDGDLDATLAVLAEDDWADKAFCVYTSPSDVNGTRFRVIMPLDREATPAECARVRMALSECLGIAPSQGPDKALDISRCFFIGRLEGTPERIVHWRDGTPSSTDELLASEIVCDWPVPKALRRARKATPKASTKATPAQLKEAKKFAKSTPPSIEGEGGDLALFRAASGVCSRCRGDEEATYEVLLETFNDRCVPAWDEAKLRREAERAAERWAAPECAWARRLQERAEARIAGGSRPVLEALADASEDGEEPLPFTTDKQGVPHRTHHNTELLVERLFADKLVYDSVRDVIRVTGDMSHIGQFPVGEWSDVHTTALVIAAERCDLRITPTIAYSVAQHYAHEHSVNPLREELLRMAEAWDGVPRVDAAMATYWGAEAGGIATAVSRVLLLSLAARGLEPGCKVDTCPVLMGAQGTLKSTSIRVLVGQEWFGDSPLPIGSKEALETMRGLWAQELPELASLSGRSRETLKAFLSSAVDRYRPSYGRCAVTHKRTTVLVGTTNESQFLDDPTGDRRFLPVAVSVARAIDLVALARDREQLLGEAARRVLAGELPCPAQSELPDLRQAQEAATCVDAWETAIAEWAEAHEWPRLRQADLVGAGAILDVPLERLDRRAQRRLGDALRRLGYQPARFSHEGRQVRGWARPGA